MKTLVHISDLHLGRDGETKRRVFALRNALVGADVDHVVVTGNLTWSGRDSELSCFQRIFAPLQATNRLTVVPGNHDRLGHDLGCAIQPGARVSLAAAAGLHIVRFDSTGPEHAPVPRERGRLTDCDVDAIADAVAAAPAGMLVVLLMHHQILSLLPAHAPERLLSWLAPSYQAELERGRRLIDILRGRCDLVLHGHGPADETISPFPDDVVRPLGVLAAGQSADLGRARVFWHEEGQLRGPPAWLTVSPLRPLTQPLNQFRPGQGDLASSLSA